MDDPLTPDEDLVFKELLRLDVEPNQIPPELFEGFLHRLAAAVSLPLPRARAALQGLIDKDTFDTSDESGEERVQKERDVLRELLLHDPEIRDLLKEIVRDIVAGKT